MNYEKLVSPTGVNVSIPVSRVPDFKIRGYRARLTQDVAVDLTPKTRKPRAPRKATGDE